MKLLGMGLILMAVAVLFSPAYRDWLLKRRMDECFKRAKGIVAGVKLEFPGCEGALNVLTLEPAIKPAATTRNITHEDFLDQLDRIDPAQTPMTTFCANEVALKATERTWNVDDFPGPKGAVGRADGEGTTAANARDWTQNVRKMGNLAQGFDEQWGAGWIAQNVPKIAGIPDPVAYAKASASVRLKLHMEVAFCSFDQTAIIDQGSGLGSIGAGYRKLTDYANRYTAATAYAIGKPTDRHYAPTGACITGALTAVNSRSLWKTIAYALRVAAQQKGDWTLIAGLTLRQAITDLTDPAVATSTSTAASAVVAVAPSQVKVFTRTENDPVLGASIDIIQTDYGRIMVTESDWIGTTTTDSSGSALSAYASTSGTGGGARGNAAFVSNAKNGLIVKRGNVFKQWGVAPFTEQLGKDGGGDTYDTKCQAMLGIRNPILAGWLNVT